MTLKTLLANMGMAVTVMVLCIPLALAVTILTYPFWCWIETRYAIESCGHSGPAEWCYLVVYVVMLFLAGIIWLLIRRGSAGRS